ncbi:MAG: glutaredoxin family protein, partial [Chloroflexi bacterium]|nr:glutaredoxin family protein [Chloroflexota bacterium]
MEKIIFYGTPWCGDCQRSRQLLIKSDIKYEEINIDQNVEAAEKVIKLNKGYRSV